MKMKKIIVCGDAAVDLFLAAKTVNSGNRSHWETQAETRLFPKNGGSLLLADFIRQAAGEVDLVSAHKINGEEEKIPSENIVSSTTILEAFPFSIDDKEKNNHVYRVKEFKGYIRPNKLHISKLPIKAADAKVMVIDDAGNGFRDNVHAWEAFLKQAKKALIVLKIIPPLTGNKLLDHLQKSHMERLVIVINADDLRNLEGTKIDRCLSWERTAKDFVWQLASNRNLFTLNNCAYLVVRFGVDGVILCRRHEGEIISQLFYNPEIEEDGFQKKYPGLMQGLTACFTASLTAALAKSGLKGIKDGIRRGLNSSRKLYQQGFGKQFQELDYPEHLFDAAAEKENDPTVIDIPNPSTPGPADPNYWSILKELTQNKYEDAARNYVLYGRDSILDKVPQGLFGKLKTLDRNEIECFRSIRNIIQEYLAAAHAERPLSIGVFGKPGSGKSFGIIQVAQSIAPDDVEKIEFNLSQFKSIDELTATFHRIRDLSFGKKVPLVFFDEFDCDFNGELGWLKYFLAPMQDGVFLEGDTLHPIGKAIFVFAGGTSFSFSEFSAGPKENSPEEIKKLTEKFKKAKVPDFLSRMRGFVDIKGPDPTTPEDHLFQIRRAMYLRLLLKRKVDHLFDDTDRAAIDPGVLRAFLKIPAYKHGIRSMEAIIEMSMLAGRNSFEQSALPSSEQLDMHVNPEDFSRLVMSEVLLGNNREIIAMKIHEDFLRHQEGKRLQTDQAMAPWNELNEGLKESNRQQADHISEKLKAVKCSFFRVSEKQEIKIITFSDNEIEFMAEMEHERFLRERLLDGWSWGKVRDHQKKTNPTLVDWEDLSENERDKDRQAVRGMPEILKNAGFEIYRL